jgi:hypothetical protein
MSAEQPIVFVIDDDESMRRGLTNLFESVSLRVEVFGTAPNCFGVSFPMLSGAHRADDLGSVRGGKAEAYSSYGPVCRLPFGAGVGVEDLSGALRQQ